MRPCCCRAPRRRAPASSTTPRRCATTTRSSSILEFPQFIAPTLVTREPDADPRVLGRDHADIIVKPLDGMGGTGVFRLQPGDPNSGSILETVTARGERTAMAQKFIPAISRRRQARTGHRRRPGAVLPGARSETRRNPRQPGRRGHRTGAGADRARPRDRDRRRPAAAPAWPAVSSASTSSAIS